MIYSTFPEKCTEMDILDMLLLDNMKAICPLCKHLNETKIQDEFVCKNCLEKISSPFDNPEEIENVRKIV